MIWRWIHHLRKFAQHLWAALKLEFGTFRKKHSQRTMQHHFIDNISFSSQSNKDISGADNGVTFIGPLNNLLQWHLKTTHIMRLTFFSGKAFVVHSRWGRFCPHCQFVSSCWKLTSEDKSSLLYRLHCVKLEFNLPRRLSGTAANARKNVLFIFWQMIFGLFNFNVLTHFWREECSSLTFSSQKWPCECLQRWRPDAIWSIHQKSNNNTWTILNSYSFNDTPFPLCHLW